MIKKFIFFFCLCFVFNLFLGFIENNLEEIVCTIISVAFVINLLYYFFIKNKK